MRGLLDTVLDLPWGELAATEVDVAAVARHLERTHYGLKDVKDRILEYLAVSRMRAALEGRDGADQPALVLAALRTAAQPMGLELTAQLVTKPEDLPGAFTGVSNSGGSRALRAGEPIHG